MDLLPKIRKRLSNVPGRPVISNFGTPTEKVSEFLDHHLKPIMQNGLSYIRDSQHFLEKIKTIGSVPENAIPVTADVVDEVEQKILETQSKKPLIWLRYIDDIFFIWTHGEQELERFLKDLNNFTPNLSFTYEASKNCIPFLDLKVKLIDGKLETDLYMKPTDCHQYLHYLSSHPQHSKRSIIYSQTLHVNRLCSLEKDFNYHKLNMKEWFIKRGYR